MFARVTLFVLALAASSCSKPQTPVQLRDVAATPLAIADPALASADKPSTTSGNIDVIEFAHVVGDQGEPLVVLSTEADDVQWTKGAPRLASSESPIVVHRDVDEAALPKFITRHLGRAVRLSGPNGEVCRGKLASPFILARVEPHFGERERWSGGEEDGVVTPPLSEQRIAEEAWGMSAGGRLLVAGLVETTGDCRDALVARAADLPTLTTAAARRPSASMTARAMAELRKLPAHGALQESYAKSQGTTPGLSWTESEDATVTVREFATDASMYVWVSASGGQPCSDFSGRIDVLWKVSGTNAKQLDFEIIYQGEAEFDPQLLAHVPGEKFPSFVGRESTLRKGSSGYAVDGLHVPFLDCPC